METKHVVVSFNLSDTGLRSNFREFLSERLTEDLTQSFHGEVSEEVLSEIKRKASSVEYADDHTSDKIVVYEHEPLGIEKTAY